MELTYKIPDAVIEDTLAYRREVEKFLSGDTSPVAFRAIRVPMGIYEQRQNDTYMVRVRGAGGVFLPHQVERVAELSREFGNGVVHVTTRQDLQIHSALIQDTPTILEKLLEVGLSSRGGGGNTVRNVSACPLAGACADEVFDVTPYALSLTEYLIGDRANFNLPRKFKAAFSGCARDCAPASVADLGFFAEVRDGVQGFAVYAGGGMGAHSSLAIEIEEWIPDTEIFRVAEAVKRLFDKHGDRANRHRARLRYVLERVGEDEFRRLYREELNQVACSLPLQGRVGEGSDREAQACPLPLQGRVSLFRDLSERSERKSRNTSDSPTHPLPLQGRVGEGSPGAATAVTIPLALGDISASALLSIAQLAARRGERTLRTTQDQNLQLRVATESERLQVIQNLSEIDPALVAEPAVKTVACAGASTCKLGLCLSRGLAEAIETELAGTPSGWEAPIRISGCPNSCGQHPVAPLGLYGSARWVNGRLVPYYAIVAGGRMQQGNARLAELVTRVPARAVPALLKEFWTAAADNRIDGESLDQLIDRWGINYLRILGKKHEVVPSYEEAPEFYRDFGSDEDFSLAGRGPGECGAGVTDVIALDIDTAKRSLEEGALYEAVTAAARSLLVTKGLEPKTDRQVFAAFSEHIIAPGWVTSDAQGLLDAAIDLKIGDRDTLNDLRDQISFLVYRVEELFKSLDSNLNFRVEPVAPAASETPPNGHEEANELDLRGVTCPMNFVRAKVHLEQFELGAEVDILLDDGEPVRNVPASFAEQGEEVVSVTAEDSHFRVRIRKRT